MKSSPPPSRRTPMPRSSRVRPRNPERRDEKHARNFGEEAERVRAMPCIMTTMRIDAHKAGRLWVEPGGVIPCCRGRTQAAHVTARGMGGAKGGRFDLVPLCDAHHREAGEAETGQRAAFELRYGISLRAEADRIALEHPRPLGLRGLADRWALGVTLATIVCGDRLDDHERDALLGWVRREMAREADVRRTMFLVGSPPSLEEIGERRRHAFDSEALARHVAQLLGIDEGVARALCEAAGWPS